MFIMSNVLVFALGGVLAVLSHKARRRLRQENLRFTTYGFALIAAAALVEAVYAPGIVDGGWLTSAQLLTLYTVESLLVAAGLACIAYSLLQY